jgi:hypothetical protein
MFCRECGTELKNGKTCLKCGTEITQWELHSIIDHMMIEYNKSHPKIEFKDIMGKVRFETPMDYPDLTEKDKMELRNILVEAYDKKQAPRDIGKAMFNKIDKLSMKQAQNISQTEIMRTSNLASCYNAKINMHARSFTVNSGPECCDLCRKTYEGKIFDIKEIDKLPPLHDKCGCVPLFSMDPVDGSNPHDALEREMGNLKDNARKKPKIQER